MQADEKAFDLKPGFITSFLDFLKTGKKQTGFEHVPDGGEQEALNPCFSLKGEITPLTSPPPPLPQTPPLPPTGTFSEGGQGEGVDLALSSCPSPCKPLDEELKGNLETLPSFSSDEEDSVSKNQDLQKSISSAISALYDTPHTLVAAMASAMVKAPPTLSTPPPPPLTPPLPAIPPLIPSTESGKEEALTYDEQQVQDKMDQQLVSPQSIREEAVEREVEQGGVEAEDGEGTTVDDEDLTRHSHSLQRPPDEQEEEEEEEKEESMSEMQNLEISEVSGKLILILFICLFSNVVHS